MRPWRWLRATWQFRCTDHRGVERVIPFPSWTRLARDGVPRAYRLHLSSMSWRIFALWFAICLLPLTVQIVGHRVWHRLVFRPWMEAARANPGAMPPPPSIRPLTYAQFASAALMAGGFIATWPICSRGIARRYTRGMLERRRCPWCTYDLSGCAPADLTTCPECGAGWRLQLADHRSA